MHDAIDDKKLDLLCETFGAKNGRESLHDFIRGVVDLVESPTERCANALLFFASGGTR